jgi:hypothetical protein
VELDLPRPVEVRCLFSAIPLCPFYVVLPLSDVSILTLLLPLGMRRTHVHAMVMMDLMPAHVRARCGLQILSPHRSAVAVVVVVLALSGPTQHLLWCLMVVATEVVVFGERENGGNSLSMRRELGWRHSSQQYVVGTSRARCGLQILSPHRSTAAVVVVVVLTLSGPTQHLFWCLMWRQRWSYCLDL